MTHGWFTHYKSEKMPWSPAAKNAKTRLVVNVLIYSILLSIIGTRLSSAESRILYRLIYTRRAKSGHYTKIEALHLKDSAKQCFCEYEHFTNMSRLQIKVSIQDTDHGRKLQTK